MRIGIERQVYPDLRLAPRASRLYPLAAMHEWALAESVIEAASAALGGRDPSTLRTVTVRIGELQAIDREIFQFALSVLRGEKSFAAAEFVLETETATFRCLSCDTEWSWSGMPGLESSEREAIHFLPEAAHAFITCPTCRSPDFRVEKGRGVSIAGITLDGP
jgi:hydrogenase nickel incorporation protein HypA/HybF